MNYYERHIGDYLKDTSHLSLLEHGIYARLLDVYYTRESGLHADEAARLIGARSKDEQKALQGILTEYFIYEGGVYTQDRCEREIERYQRKVAHNREVGKLGGRPKKTETQPEPKDNPGGYLQEPEHNPLQSPDTSLHTEAIASVAPAKARATKKCPSGFAPSDPQAFIDDECPGVDWQNETKKFRDHSFATARTDWDGTWRNWMRKAFEGRKQSTPTEGHYTRQMRERYEQFAPMVAAKQPGAKRVDNPMEILDGLTRPANRPDLLEMQPGVRPGLHEPVGGD